MANLQSQIDILGKAIVREHIKREDDKTEMIAINDKMLQTQYGGRNSDGIATISLADELHTQSHLSATLINRNIKTKEIIGAGIYEEVDGELKDTTISANITGSSDIKFHIEDDDEHHVDGFIIIDDKDKLISIESKTVDYNHESTGKTIKDKPLKFIGSSSQLTIDEETKSFNNNKIYIIDSMGNIIPNTKADTKTSSITINSKEVWEINNLTFDRELVGGMYRLADLNSNYKNGGGHEINFINLNISEGTGANTEEVVQG